MKRQGGNGYMRRLSASPAAVRLRDVAAPRMTDHALVRLLERSGIDVEGIRVGIEAGLASAHGAALALGGADHLITVDGMSFVVRGGAVTTVLTCNDVRDRARALAPRD